MKKIVLTIPVVVACLVSSTAIRLISATTRSPTAAPARVLTFEERVSYQRAIEDVYWRHRIWPKERPDHKPSLDEVMSRGQLEEKVTDYLRKSLALEDYWKRPITAEQLQAEMDRMAQHTREPEVLRELFDALGNDPSVIAECLARPALADRLLNNWYAYDESIHSEMRQRAEAELQGSHSVEDVKHISGTYNETEFVKSENASEQAQRDAGNPVKLNRREWDETVQKLATMFASRGVVTANSARNKPLRLDDMPRAQPTSVALDKPELAGVAWPTTRIRTGVVSALQEDPERFYVMAVIEISENRLTLATVSWLKEPLTVWLARTETPLPVGMPMSAARCVLPKISDGAECVDDTWRATTAAPNPRHSHTAVWTGSEMIVWGGYFFTGIHPLHTLNSGGRYNPSTDSWTPTNTTNAPTARADHTAVWTGSQMIVWGGKGDDGSFTNTGGRYNPTADSWTATSTTNAPSGRVFHTAVWTGNEMIVWGGWAGNIPGLNTGARYNPTTDSWAATGATNVPTARYHHTAVWTGTEMIVWGGGGLNTGGRYNPSMDSWTATSLINAPMGRTLHTAVWADSEMIIWGGYTAGHDANTGGAYDINTGGRYDPATNSWIATSTSNTPPARDSHTAVWTGSEMIVWGGDSCGGIGCPINTGGRYNPTTNSWIATSTISAPAARLSHTAIWTGSEMIVWGGSDGLDDFNTGGRYDPTTNSWVPTGPFNVPDARAGHTAVWTGSEMVIWGGYRYDHTLVVYLNTGAKYYPSIDSWTPTNITAAASERATHTAVWTGIEMIVWGGYRYEGLVVVLLNTGGKYYPNSDSWRPMSTTNAPDPRWGHTAVWTGSNMIIWGGWDSNNPTTFNTGGTYNPGRNSWTATSTANAPVGRRGHTAVWTGTEMIVWGGNNFGLLNTGGRYNPRMDSWTATNTGNAPEPRWLNTAAWTGSDMIIWGGAGLSGGLNTGARYNPGADSWIATSTTNAPSPRYSHTSVWTGNEVIVWGGYQYPPGHIDLDTGGRYQPSTDSWTATTTDKAPSARDGHTAVWTGSEMIVWAGANSLGLLYTGGAYCAQSGPLPTPTPTPVVTPRPRPTPPPRPTQL